MLPQYTNHQYILSAMKETVNTRALWNNAGIAGAALGLLTVSCMFIEQAVAGVQLKILVTATGIILWTVKFAGCILLMRFFMLRLCKNFDGVTSGITMKYGTMTAFLSALINSAVLLANMLFISPGIYEQQYDQIMQAYSGLLDANSMGMMEKMESALPKITFFTQLIYCFLYGTVLSLILSRYIPKQDPFAGYDSSENSRQA